MALQTYPGSDGLYAVDWELLMRICRSHVRARATFNNAQRVVLEEHLIGPTVYAVNVNWDAVRADVERDSRAVYEGLRRTAQASMSRAASIVRQMVDETRYYKDRFSELQREVTRTSMENIDSSVERLGTTVAVLREVRDYSAEFVLVSAGFVSGGATLAAVGTGSLLKGTAKWEDSGSFAAGVATASTELLFSIIPVKLKVAGVSQINQKIAALVLAHAKIPAEMYKAAVEGKPIISGVIAGGLKFQDPAGLELLKNYATKDTTSDKLRMVALAATAVVKLARNAGVKKVQQMAMSGAGTRPGMKSPAPSPVPPPMPHLGAGIVDLVAFDASCIGDYAICRM